MLFLPTGRVSGNVLPLMCSGMTALSEDCFFTVAIVLIVYTSKSQCLQSLAITCATIGTNMVPIHVEARIHINYNTCPIGQP